MKSHLDGLPENVIAAIFSHLDLRSRLRAARVCRRFWNTVFTSHDRSAVWAGVRIGPDVDLVGKSTRDADPQQLTLAGLLEQCSEGGLIKSLQVAAFSAAKLEAFPPMPGVLSLSLEGKFKVTRMSTLQKLATRFPHVEAFETPEADWSCNVLCGVRNAFPSLHQIQIAAFGQRRLYDADVNKLLDTCDNIRRVIIREWRLSSPTGSTLDRLIGSSVTENLRGLFLTRWLTRPQTPLEAFKSLTHLHIGPGSCSREVGVWIAGGLPKLPNVKHLGFCSYDHLDLLWAMPGGCLPPNLSKLELQHRCKYLDSAFVSSVALRFRALAALGVTGCDLSFRLSEAVPTLLGPDSRLARLYISGRLSTLQGNCNDELNQVFRQLTSPGRAFKHLCSLYLMVNLISGDGAVADLVDSGVQLKLDDENDLRELIRLMLQPYSSLQIGRKEMKSRQE